MFAVCIDGYYYQSVECEASNHTFKYYKSKSVCYFLLMEMPVHQSETAHDSNQKKKKDIRKLKDM
jgi:hypothetical protein